MAEARARVREASCEALSTALEGRARRALVLDIREHDELGDRSDLVADTQKGVAAIVDPLREHVDHYLDVLSARGWTLAYTIETHTHADHLSGSVRLKDLTGAKMLMHEGSPAPCVDRTLSDGDVIAVGDVKVEVVATAGHTRDGVCLVLPGRVLTGDTLLIGGCGRTDLPTGSAEEMQESCAA